MDYKSTLNLPQTEFPMKASLPQREPERVAQWQREGAYQKMISRTRSKPIFTLHDGPPYANGNIHLGHTLNKVLKDIVIKYQNMSGKHAELIPGWDCHGLPIELGVEKQLREKKEDKASLSRVKIRELCKEYALTYVERQKEQFKRLGILCDWDAPYLTLSDDYVANIVRELGRISDAGNLYKGNKPVYWCASCATALAEAEIEYHDHTSPSIYVKFFLQQTSVEKNSVLSKVIGSKPVAAVIWTTTPWTLPANLGISVHPEFEYVLLDAGKEILLIAEGLREKFLAEVGMDPATPVLGKVSGEKLDKVKADHPFMKRTSLLMLGEHVTLEAGTGLVHTAPGHGVDDYKTGIRYGLDVFAPVDAHGAFTVDVPDYQGKKIWEANPLIVDRLHQSGHLIQQKKIKHSYPHCWRCSNPVLFRATPQWFIGMDRTRLRERAIAEIHKTQWIPAWGINRILGMVEGRPDWCVSRQRIWGVPITVFYCDACGESVHSKASFEHVADILEENGPNAWYEWPAEKLLKPGVHCKCGNAEASKFRKETDILDVWFDSGVSHAAVLAAPKNKGKVQWPADLYLEGSDQHRGWFQTSLLTAVESRGSAPFKRVLTHGFVNDKDGKKMSKSKGNVIDPLDFVAKNGAEILRLWVVIEDYRNDINFSMETIDRVSESYRKIRNTFRYILGNLYDFDVSMLPKSEADYCDLDQWALARTEAFLSKVTAAYDSYEFHQAYHALVNFCANDLSALYFDILKDRLYTSGKNSKERRSSQAALYRIGVALSSSLAPILSFTAEEVWGYLRQNGSVFESDFPSWNSVGERNVIAARVEKVLELREPINKKLEELRAAKTIGHSLEAAVEVVAPEKIIEQARLVKEDLARVFIVSSVNLKAGGEISVNAAKAEGSKCARCWTYTNEVGRDTAHPTICGRCVLAVNS